MSPDQPTAVALYFNSLDDLAHALRGPGVIPWDDSAFGEDFKADWRNRANHVIALSRTPASGPVEADDRLAVAVEKLRAEINAPLTGPTHGVWDRARIAGLKEALALLTKSGEAEG